MPPVDDIQRSNQQVGPLRFPDKPEAKEITWKLWQASGVTANVCYLDRHNPYGKDPEE